MPLGRRLKIPEQTELDADDEASPTEVKGEVNREIEEYDENEDGTHDIEDANDDFGDDFDEFEEGEEAGDDDFGDFDEGFQQEAEEPEPQQQQPSLPPKTSVPVSEYLANTMIVITTIRSLHFLPCFLLTVSVPSHFPISHSVFRNM